MRQSAVATLERAIDPPESFETFFDHEHPRLLRALFLVTGNAQEAEDLMQEAFLNVWERWERVRNLEDPVGYLYRTGMNAWRSRMRRAMVAARRSVGRPVGRDEFARVEERDVVARALSKLTRRQRAAIVLTEFLGYGNEEAAAILGIKAVTVRVLASQGRAALREVLGGSDE